MSSTTFTDQVTPVVASWLNDVNNATYNGIIGAQAISYADTGIAGTFASTVAGYSQVIIQNKSTATNASANLNISNNAATASTNFIELGINSSTFTGTGSFSQPGYSYVASASTDLVLGTYTAKPIRFVYNSGATDSAFIDSTGFNAVNVTATLLNSPSLRGYIAGLTMSTAGSSPTMAISAGVSTDSTNTAMLQLSSAISKTTSNWLVGTAVGGKSLAAAIANNTWYHFYVIRRPDTGVVDVCFSTNAAGLLADDYTSGGGNIPTAYTQYRRIGSGKTDGSAQWTRFVQEGDYFDWFTPVLDITASNPGTSAVSRTLSVPTGVTVYARFNGGLNNAAAAVFPFMYFSALDTADLTPSGTVAPLANANYNSNNAGGTENGLSTHIVKTNTSAQIRSRISASDASCIVRIATLGWIDSRGRDL